MQTPRARLENKRLYYLANRNQILLDKKKRAKLVPWLLHLSYARTRCTNRNRKDWKDYGGKGIQCLLKANEIKYLWFRDKAWLLKKPSIDRIKSDKNYTVDNCQFIELSKNSSERNTRVLSKPILQFDLQGNFLKEWTSTVLAKKGLNLKYANISSNAKGIYKSSGGFIWKYK